MADTFFAKNSMKAADLFYERSKYKALAFAKSGSPAIKDFWDHELIFYGRVDTQGSIVIPRKEKLRALPVVGKKSLFALDFVADAFKDLKKNVSALQREGCLATENPDGTVELYLTSFEPARAYKNPAKGYGSQLKRIYDSFLSLYMKEENQYTEVMNFEEFRKAFHYFALHYLNGMPFNLSSFVISPFNSVLGTGLAIDIAELDAGDDPVKEEKFLDNSRLKLYQNLAQEYGFYIDKNVPWRLVADLGSTTMRPYILARHPEMSDVRSMFEEYYDTATSQDFTLMRSQLIRFYNRFVTSRPHEMIPQRECSTKFKTVYREPAVTEESLAETYSDADWVEMYANFRNLESAIAYPLNVVTQIIKNAKDLANKVDTTKAIDYIDYKFKGFTAAPGSTGYDSLSNYLSSGGYSVEEKKEIIQFTAQTENTVIY